MSEEHPCFRWFEPEYIPCAVFLFQFKHLENVISHVQNVILYWFGFLWGKNFIK